MSVTTNPALAAFSAQTRLLVVAPHPDDETIANGLLIQQVRAAGGTVGILLLTRGDNNPWPQRWLERRWRISAADRARWGNRRRTEMDLALRQLDVPPANVQTLGWPDMGVTDALLSSDGSAQHELLAAASSFRPTLIAAPALGDHHPDHGAAHVLLRLALAAMDHPPLLWGYVVHGHMAAGQVIETHGEAAQQAIKQSALAAYRSQLALSGGRLRRLAARAECHVLPATGTLSPHLPWRPSRSIQPWLKLTLAGPAGCRQWSWRDAPLELDGQGGYRLCLPNLPSQGPCFTKLSLAMPSPWIFDHWGWHEL